MLAFTYDVFCHQLCYLNRLSEQFIGSRLSSGGVSLTRMNPSRIFPKGHLVWDSEVAV